LCGPALDRDAAFVLLGHWFEMRARGGANDAIRALLDLAPPRVTVIRDGAALEISTAEVVAGDLLLVRPGDKVGVDGVVEQGQSEVDESVVTGGERALARVDGRKVAVGDSRLMDADGVDLGALAGRREEMASAGRTVVCVAVNGRAVALIGIADTPGPPRRLPSRPWPGPESRSSC
jgi:cation transport ATPase